MKSSSKEPESIIIEERITKVNGEFFVKKYTQGQLLGKGGFAKVYLFTNMENNKVLAGKVIPKVNLNRSRSRQKLMVEIRLHQSVHHQNIVKFEHVFEDQDNVYILLELCQNQSMNELFKRRKRLTEFEVQCYLIQLIDAIKYMHSNRIIHRDLKLGNLFLSDQMQIKIGDFGLAAKLEFDGEKKRTICGTPNYIAPEILDGNIGHSYEVDVWSVGVILFTLLTGKPPFETTDIKLTYKKIKENNYAFPDNVTLSSNVKDLIKKILVTQPEKRPTLDEILQHPFIDYGGPIPKLMPISTLACPPSSSYMKQFSSSTTSQRIRIATEIDQHDSQDGSSNPKSYFVNTNKPSALPKTPSGSQVPTIDLFRMTPKTPQMQFFGQDRFNPAAIVSHDKSKFRFPTTPQTQTQTSNQKITFPIDVQEEVQEKEHIPTIVEEEHKTMETDREDLGLRVLKWYDYSTKYGLGYILSNGTIGVSFNDGAKVVVPPGNFSEFEYINKDPFGKNEVRKKYSFDEYPENLHQKVLIYNRFKEHFESIITDSVRIKELIYIKKWIKTKAALFFRLNNRVLQVSFKDKTTIIMDTDEKKLTFIGQNDDIHFCPLESAISIENKEISKRVKYIEEVLRQIWNAQSETTAKKSENASSEGIEM